MKVIDSINNAEKPFFAVEFLPPLKGHSLSNFDQAFQQIKDLKPAYINFTCHQKEVVYRDREDGLLERCVVAKRPGTIGLSAAVMYKYDITVVPHLICGGFSREETEDALIELNFLGLENVFALRGDPQAGQRTFLPEPDGHAYASDLVRQIRNMNDGIYLDRNIRNPEASHFCVGVAGYPEKHCEAPNRETDLMHLKNKVDAGADYIVTQMFFINEKYFRFVEDCRSYGITVPIIPGIKPITMKNDVNLLPKTFSIDLPSELYRDVANCATNYEAQSVGTQYAILQVRELLAAGVPGIHFFSLGMTKNIREIVLNTI
ncbi:MAG: methylenetetrahydrofolate reductase [NAD(P)H] [Bacteroidia bacterium]|nr:methylenetetrahydrofolate reductase [NAD(P)H] [Bacteroidia bacterium]